MIFLLPPNLCYFRSTFRRLGTAKVSINTLTRWVTYVHRLRARNVPSNISYPIRWSSRAIRGDFFVAGNLRAITLRIESEWFVGLCFLAWHALRARFAISRSKEVDSDCPRLDNFFSMRDHRIKAGSILWLLGGILRRDCPATVWK